MILNLTEREKNILYFTVSEYISTGIPVASRTIAKKYPVKISAPSIRNIMSSLEEKGLLYQPHVSAGRIPTDEGLSYFVDELMIPEPISKEETLSIEEKFKEIKSAINFWEKFGEFISEITQQAVVIISPPPHLLTLREIRFIPISNKRLLVIMITSSGEILNKVINLEFKITRNELERIHNYLNSIIKDKSLVELRESLKIEIAHYSKISSSWILKALKLGNKAVDNIWDPRIIIEGFSNLISQLSPDEQSVIKNIISTIEKKEMILSLIDKIIDKGVVVYIGKKSPLKSFYGCSLIMTNYVVNNNYICTAGIIGSKRMNYPKVIPLIKLTRTLLRKVFLNEGY